MFVDAITREGMSGSPVLYFGDEITDISGRPGPAPDPRREPWLVGVYAGRDGVTGEEIEMALGRVWHKRLLDEIFYHRVPGDTPIGERWLWPSPLSPSRAWLREA